MFFIWNKPSIYRVYQKEVDNLEPENFTNIFRPISLLSIFFLIFEKVVHNRIIDFMNFHEFEFLYPLQYGFRKNHSTVSSLIYLMNKIARPLEQQIVINLSHWSCLESVFFYWPIRKLAATILHYWSGWLHRREAFWGGGGLSVFLGFSGCHKRDIPSQAHGATI
jgi:hypothetical protein